MKLSVLAALVTCVPALVKAAGTGNPFEGATVLLNSNYVEKVKAAVANISDSSLAAKAALVEQIPVFLWMDVAASVPKLGEHLTAADAAGGTPLVQAVIYDLPDRDCSANASAGEYTIADGGAEKYQAYIDAIAAQVEQHPNVRVVFVVEPDGLANLVTNLDVAKCANAESTQKELISYAISKLQQDNVWLYVDAGHSGWLGWTDNLSAAARLFVSIIQGAGNNASIAGFATDVSNYNLLRGEKDPAQGTNPNYNEELYVNALAALLEESGISSKFIVDQGRSGVSGIRDSEAEWCNVIGAGIGPRPSTDTNNTLIDSIVWVKPPGESDGTSNTSSPRYDTRCGGSSAAQNAPEAGAWFQSYFEMLVQNANPPLE